MTAKEHYDTHLGKIYSWMSGDFQESIARQLEFFKSNKICPSSSGVAIDLGAGHGIQAVALAGMGFKVKAVDFNEQLLSELSRNKEDLPIDVYCKEILEFLHATDDDAELISCMGDTLTHLPDIKKAHELLTGISAKLSEGGKVVVSFRDLTEERKNEDRFFHVRSDDARSLVCFLEYFPEHVQVHDIILEKAGGRWAQKISSYPKLRISAGYVKDVLEKSQIIILHESLVRGMTCLVGMKVMRSSPSD